MARSLCKLLKEASRAMVVQGGKSKEELVLKSITSETDSLAAFLVFSVDELLQ